MVVVSALSLIVSIGAATATAEARGITFQTNETIVPEIMLLIVSLAFLPITLHLALIFPHDRPILKRRPHLISWIYAGPAFIAVFGIACVLCASTKRNPSWFLDRMTLAMLAAGAVTAVWMIPKVRAEGLRKAVAGRPFAALLVPASIDFAIFDTVSHKLPTFAAVIIGIAFLLPLAAVPIYPIAACVSLARSYREASLEEKRQLRWPLWGTFTAIVMKIVCIAIAFVWTIYLAFHPTAMAGYTTFMSAVTITPRLAPLLIPLSFAAAILKYRLMNIDILIKKTVMYAMLSGMLIFLYLFLVGGLGSLLIRIAGVQDQTIVVASTLILALLFVPVRNRLQQLIDRNLFRQRYDYPQALRTISAETMTASDLGAFLQFTAEALQQALPTRGIAIFLRRQNDFVAMAKVGFPDSILGTLRTTPDLTSLLDRPFAPHRRQVAEEDAAVLRRVDAKLVVPVRTSASVQGFIALAGKLSDREFDLDDVDFLSSAADQVAMTTERIRLQREEVEFEQAR